MGLSELEQLATRFANAGGKRITVTDGTARTVAYALRVYADIIANPRDEGAFTIDAWGPDGHLFENLARSSNGLVARAAFDQACEQRPSLKVTLRQGIRLVATREPAKA